jgi:hypothetical protein
MIDSGHGVQIHCLSWLNVITLLNILFMYHTSRSVDICLWCNYSKLSTCTFIICIIIIFWQLPSTKVIKTTIYLEINIIWHIQMYFLSTTCSSKRILFSLIQYNSLVFNEIVWSCWQIVLKWHFHYSRKNLGQMRHCAS